MRMHFLDENERTEVEHSVHVLPSTMPTLVAFVLINGAVVVQSTFVRGILSHAAPEEAFAAIARDRAVVLARRSIAAHDTVEQFAAARRRAVARRLNG